MAQPISEHFNTDFCLRLPSQVLDAQISKATSNFVASPLSLHVMLSLAATGSTGHTLNQLLQFLRSPSVSDLNSSSSRIVNLALTDHKGNESLNNGGPLMAFVNGAWVDGRFNLKPSIEANVKDTYNAGIRNVDFVFKPKEAVDEVNSWAEKQTKGLIEKLVSYDAVNCDTVLVLTNALYFKGAWDRKFDPSRTKARDFHLLNGKTVRAPFMTTHSSVRLHSYGSLDGVKVLRIPYQSGRDPRDFFMYIFLPDEKDGLLNLVRSTGSNPSMLNQDFQLVQDKLTELWIPRFKFSFEFEAAETMRKLGLQLLFCPGELTEIVDDPIASKKLHVSSVFHKACIEVNEEGTEAAACTAMFMELQCFRRYPSFIADHPFLFMIREETHKVVFFVGAVLNPLQE